VNFDDDFSMPKRSIATERPPTASPGGAPRQTTPSGERPMTTSKANKKSIHWGQFTAKFISYALITLIAILNLQPWFPIATTIAGEVIHFPFIDSLLNIPIPVIGGLISMIVTFIVNNLVNLVAILLWFLVQFSQLMFWAKEDSEAAAVMDKLFGLATSRIDKDLARRFSAVSYAIEAVVCFVYYPPYEGGFQGFMDDWNYWNWDSLQIDQLILFGITLFAFELFVRYVVIGLIWKAAK
jgi:hypothetical protein